MRWVAHHLSWTMRLSRIVSRTWSEVGCGLRVGTMKFLEGCLVIPLGRSSETVRGGGDYNTASQSKRTSGAATNWLVLRRGTCRHRVQAGELPSHKSAQRIDE